MPIDEKLEAARIRLHNLQSRKVHAVNFVDTLADEILAQREVIDVLDDVREFEQIFK